MQCNAAQCSAMQCSVCRHSGNLANNTACEKILAYIAKLLLWKYFQDGALICFLHLIYFFLTFYCLICFLCFLSPLRFLFYLFTTSILCSFLCFNRTPNRVTAIFHWHNPSFRTMGLVSTHPLTNDYQEYFLRGKGGRCLRLTRLPPSCADCHEIWEPQPPANLGACPGSYRDCRTLTSTVTFTLTFNHIDVSLFLSLFLVLPSFILIVIFDRKIQFSC
jgi:hypothetical protein